MITKRLRHSLNLVLATGLTLAGTGAAFAGGGDYEHDKQSMQQSQKTIRGKVVALKTVKLKGSDQRNAMALIRTSEGKRKIVDLGPRSAANQLQLSAGDQLTVRGKMVDVGDREIVLASHVRTQDDDLTIDRSQQRRQFERASQQARSEMSCPPEDDQG